MFLQSKWLLLLLLPVCWLIFLQLRPQSVRVPEFRLSERVAISDALDSCDAGILVIEDSSSIVLRDWHGRKRWSVQVPHHGSVEKVNSSMPYWRSGWTCAVSREGGLLALAIREERHTRLTIFNNGQQTFDRLFTLNDDYLGLNVDKNRVTLWGRSTQPYPIWIVHKSIPIAHGYLPWRGCQITPGGYAVVAPDLSSEYYKYHGYDCLHRAHYGLLRLTDSKVNLISTRLIHGMFSITEPSSLSGLQPLNYPRIVNNDLLFNGGTVLSLDGKRYQPTGNVDSWEPFSSWTRSDTWISYSPSDMSSPHEVIEVASGERWLLPDERMHARHITERGQFLLVESMPHTTTLTDYWWELGHNEITSPSGRAQSRRYLGVLERPGVWRAVLPIASDVEEYWPQGAQTYRVGRPVLSPDGKCMTLIGKDRQGASYGLFFTW